MTDEEWKASLDRLARLGPPPDLGLDWDEGPANEADPDGGGFLTAEIIAAAREASAQQAAASARAARAGTTSALGVIGAALGRRGPGHAWGRWAGVPGRPAMTAGRRARPG